MKLQDKITIENKLSKAKFHIGDEVSNGRFTRKIIAINFREEIKDKITFSYHYKDEFGQGYCSQAHLMR